MLKNEYKVGMRVVEKHGYQRKGVLHSVSVLYHRNGIVFVRFDGNEFLSSRNIGDLSPEPKQRKKAVKKQETVTPTTRHVHADLIIAWANGAKIEYRSKSMPNWQDVPSSPSWRADVEYRIKQEPKPDVVRYTVTFGEKRDCFPMFCTPLTLDDAIKHKEQLNGDQLVCFTWDGETRKLKSVEIV